jgi:replicative DNA helicase
MYKTVSIHQDTYQNLNAIASRLDKPKYEVIDDLVKGYMEQMKGKDRRELEAFNAEMRNLAKQITMPAGTKVSTDDIDKDFAYLKDIDY